MDEGALAVRFPQLAAWERGEKQPTLKQLETFAKATHTPIGFLFLQKPPIERVPIPDLRTVRNRPVDAPSPDLLETVYQCQQRQDWYREFARWTAEPTRAFVGSITLEDDVVDVATRIRSALKLDLEERRKLPSWTDALRRLIEQADNCGVLVMISGVVGSDNHRKLEPQEFRGFALVDKLAPLIFINGADSKAAQMFTLAHELAHVWLGQPALDDASPGQTSADGLEAWCNQVAAELLVPLAALEGELQKREDLSVRLTRLARQFKVSSLVILRRLSDAGALSKSTFHKAYETELERLTPKRASTGGDFYNTLPGRVGKRFARALVVSTLEGQTLYRDAFRLLGISKAETLHELGRSLDLPI